MNGMPFRFCTGIMGNQRWGGGGGGGGGGSVSGNRPKTKTARNDL